MDFLDDELLISKNDFVQIDFDEVDALPDLQYAVDDPIQTNNKNCVWEKTIWKYTRCVMYINAFISPFRAFIYVLLCLVCLLCRSFEKAKDAAGESLKSVLVLFAAVAAITATTDLFYISNCIAETLYDFLIGGLILQICLGLGDALINCALDCNPVHLTFDKLLESILEPIVFVGGFFSIYLFVKADKDSMKAQRAKYSAIGNLIGSTLAVSVASYLCFRLEEFVVSNTTTVGPVVEVDWDEYSFGLEEPNFSKDIVSNMFDKKNSILAMNAFARMFAEIFVKGVETFTHKLQKVITK